MFRMVAEVMINERGRKETAFSTKEHKKFLQKTLGLSGNLFSKRGAVDYRDYLVSVAWNPFGKRKI